MPTFTAVVMSSIVYDITTAEENKNENNTSPSFIVFVDAPAAESNEGRTPVDYDLTIKISPSNASDM